MTENAHTQQFANTDREVWREREGDYYADSIHVTENGDIGINCGGRVVVLPVREWHRRALQSLTTSTPERLWLWRNFVDGEPQYWAFDNAYPCFPNGDPITRGEPCGYALVKQSTKGRHDVSDEQVIAAIKRGLAPSEGAQRDAERYLILRALGCVYADKPFSHGDALCTPGRVGGDYADSFADAALSRRPA